MTNHWIDIKNSDVIMIIGSNAAENHPISFKYVQEAMNKGAKLVVVDPRYTKTASKASYLYSPGPGTNVQLYSKIRSGTDIAFIMGMMKYAIDNGKVNWQYLRDCTNAGFLLDPNFQTCRFKNPNPTGAIQTGIFSGLEDDTRRHKKYKYNKGSSGTNPGYWSYQYHPSPPAGTKQPLVDLTLTNPNSVVQKLIEQLSVYTIDNVSKITGALPGMLGRIYHVYTNTFQDDKSACIMYAMGSTQHTHGTQNVRAYAMLQLLLGNIGVAGGGINALRGESNAQGSTDMCLLWDTLPGYLNITDNSTGKKDRASYKNSYMAKYIPQDPTPGGGIGNPVSLSWWRNGPKYIDSLLQAWWPLENPRDPQQNLDKAYHYLPKAHKDFWYSHICIFEDMTSWTADPLKNVPAKDQYIYGLMCWGQNPAVSGPNSSFGRKALKNLHWLLCVDMWDTETASFWKPKDLNNPDSECLGIPGVKTKDIDTEVYLLPAAASYEKEGSVVNSGRWSQWQYKATEPPGQAMDDLSIINALAKKLIALYQADPRGLLSDPVANLWWGPYCDPATDHYDAHGEFGGNYKDMHEAPRGGLALANPHKVGWEINGYFRRMAGGGAVPGRRVLGFWNDDGSKGTLRENGETSSGNWLYCSHYVNPGDPINSFDNSDTTPDGNRQANRVPVERYRADGNYIGLYQNWSICWPLNQRILYNGASVYQTGHPNVGQPLAPHKWVVAYDANGCELRPGSDVCVGFTPPGGDQPSYPFIMLSEGLGKIFGPSLEDGPFPEYYESWETVLTSNVISDTLTSPTLFALARPEAYEHPGNGNPEFPIVGTTYRAGSMARNLPWLCQLQPDAFVELSEELAGILGISNGDIVEIKTQRTELYGKRMKTIACVTKRFKLFTINGRTVHHIGVVWHWGYTGLATGPTANELTAHIGDANTAVPEIKCFICNIRRYPGGFWL